MTFLTQFFLLTLLLSLAALPIIAHASSDLNHEKTKNKFREREASDDMLGYPNLDEDSLLNSKCPRHVELRWQTEVSSSVYAPPLVADINSDGKLDIVVPSFVHYLEVLEGFDGDKVAGWPAFHQSTVHASPLLYDIDKDGIREIVLATYNGVILFFRTSGYLMTDKLEIPRRKVPRNWYVGLHPDPVDRSHPDVHDDELIHQPTDTNPMSQASNVSTLLDNSVQVNGNITNSGNESVAASSGNINQTKEDLKIDLPVSSGNTVAIDLNEKTAPQNSSHSQRRLLEDGNSQDSVNTNSVKNNEDVQTLGATVENDAVLDEDASSSFDLFRNEELADEYNYDYDDYVDESMWGDEDWTEGRHEMVEDYVNVDSHILSTPVIADIDNDGIQEMIVAVSYFFDRDYYDNPEHAADLGGIDIEKYIAGSIVVFNLDSKQVKWTAELDLSIDNGTFRGYIYSSPTVADLDGDGYLDILIGTSYGLFYVLDHHGKVRDKFPLEMAEIQAPVIPADINDDGKIELITADAHGNVAAWTTGGEEIWEAHLKSLIPQAPTVGDIDGDGHSEIIVPTVSGNIYVLRGKDGTIVHPFPYRTHGRVMNQVLLLDLNKNNQQRSLTLVTTSFDGYLYLIDGKTACADVVDIGETSYSMVLAENVDGGDDLDLIVTTMNGNVFCFSTPAPHHPLKTWRSSTQGRNNFATRHNREGIYVSHASRAFRDEEGKHFWIELEIVDQYRLPSGYQGPYNVTTSLFVPGNYQGDRRIVQHHIFNQPGKQQIKLPTVTVRTTGTVVVEMVDKNGLYFYDEFTLTFHMHYYKLLKWLLLLPILGMFAVLLMLQPQEAAPLPSFSRNTDL